MPQNDNGLNWSTLSNEFGFTHSNNLFRNSLGHINGIIDYGRIVVSTYGGVTFTNIIGNLEENIGIKYI